MKLNVVFTCEVKTDQLGIITDLIGLVSLDAIFIIDVEVPAISDFESMAEIIEVEFNKRHPGKYYSSYTIKMPIVA